MAFRYVGADDLAKLEQVSHNSAEGTKQSGFITQYIEGFYNKFTETKENTEIKNGYTGNYLFEKDPGDQYGFLCDNPDERLALIRLFKNQVRSIPLTRNFVQDESITTGLDIDFNRIVRLDADCYHTTYYIYLPRSYRVAAGDPDKYEDISAALFKLERRLKRAGYIRTDSGECTHAPIVANAVTIFCDNQGKNLRYNEYMESFYSRFNNTEMRNAAGRALPSDYLYDITPKGNLVFLSEDIETQRDSRKVLHENVKMVLLTRNFVNDKKITAGLNLDFKKIIIKDLKNPKKLYLYLPRYYYVGTHDPKDYAKILNDFSELNRRLKEAGYIEPYNEYDCLAGSICRYKPTKPNRTPQRIDYFEKQLHKQIQLEYLLHQQTEIQILPGKTSEEKQKYFEENVIPQVTKDKKKCYKELPQQLLDEILTALTRSCFGEKPTDADRNRMGQIYRQIQQETEMIPTAEVPGFNYEKDTSRPGSTLRNYAEHKANRSFCGPFKKIEVLLEGEPKEMSYNQIRNGQLEDELPIWHMFGRDTFTVTNYLDREIGYNHQTTEDLRYGQELGMIDPTRFKTILHNLSRNGSLSSASFLKEMLDNVLQNMTALMRPGGYYRLNENLWRNVLTLLQYFQTPYDYNEMFLRRTVIQLLLQHNIPEKKRAYSAGEDESRVLDLFLEAKLVEEDNETVKILRDLIGRCPRKPGSRVEKEEYELYKEKLLSIFPDALKGFPLTSFGR